MAVVVTMMMMTMLMMMMMMMMMMIMIMIMMIRLLRTDNGDDNDDDDDDDDDDDGGSGNDKGVSSDDDDDDYDNGDDQVTKTINLGVKFKLIPSFLLLFLYFFFSEEIWSRSGGKAHNIVQRCRNICLVYWSCAQWSQPCWRHLRCSSTNCNST